MFYDEDYIYYTEYSAAKKGWLVYQIRDGNSYPCSEVKPTEALALKNWKDSRLLYNDQIMH